jgi:hypothetical protein
VRFLGRKVYADLIVVLISAIRLKLDLNLPHATLPSIPIEFPENLAITLKLDGSEMFVL